MITILKILLWVVVAIPILNFIDYRTTKNGEKPFYLLYHIFRGFLFILWGSLLVREVPYGPGQGKEYAFQLIYLILFALSTFWVEYELIRNLWSKRPWDYYDHKEGDSGYIDLFFKKIGSRGFHITCKILVLIISILSGIRLYYL